MGTVFGYIFLFLGIVVGLIAIPFGLPGVGIILLTSLIYALATDFQAAIGINFLVALSLFTLLAETADNWLMALGTKKFGGSTASGWLSLVGAFLGGILGGAPLILVLGPAGPFVGGFLGAFLAVFLYEFLKKKSPREALRAGWGALLGRMAGIAFKMVVGMSMAAAITLAILF